MFKLIRNEVGVLDKLFGFSDFTVRETRSIYGDEMIEENYKKSNIKYNLPCNYIKFTTLTSLSDTLYKVLSLNLLKGDMVPTTLHGSKPCFIGS